MQRTFDFICWSLLIILVGCQTSNVSTVGQFSNDNKYDSEFPVKSISNEIKYISRTVKKLDILAFYSTYYFPPNSNVSRNSINDSILDVYSDNMIITNESVSGTASVVYYDNLVIGLLTCAHVVDFKDTVYTNYENENNRLKTISVKIKQQNHVSGLPQGEKIEIIAMDKKKDIALLMKKIAPTDQNVHTLDLPTGTINDLQWASIVYIMGYPLGNLMVTRAIVSISDKMNSGVFVTDALYNHGISGSPVFAIRDGVPNFELIGMAFSSSAQKSNILIAEEDFESEENQRMPYNGKIFIDDKKLINYGVTYSVSIDEILFFISTNKNVLQKKGFVLNNFFK